MKNKLMIFTVLAMCLCMGTQTWAVNLVTDPGFDVGGGGNIGNPANVPTAWTAIGSNGWVHSDVDANGPRFLGVQTVKIYGTDSSVYQDVPVTAGSPYTFSVDVYSPTAPNPWAPSTYDQLTGGRDAVVLIQWLDASSVQIGADEMPARFVGGVDPDDTWHTVSGLSTAPAGAVNVRFHVTVDDVSSSAGAPNFENAFVELAIHPTMATGGSPGSGFANPDTTTELTWVNPTTTPPLTEIYFVESATPLDPNETHPNSAKKALDAAPVYDSCTNACESSAVTLTEGYYYAWRVVCDNIDPNSSVDWIFDTFNTAPATSAGSDENAWLVSGTVDVDLDGTANDYDNYPGNPLTYDWTQTAGTPVTIADVEDPNVTITAAGTYTFELEASDGIDSSTDDVTITVYAEADDRLVAHWDFQNDLDEIVENTDPTSETWTGKTPLGPTDLDGTAGGVSAIAYVSGVASKEGSDTAIELDGTNWVEIAVDPNWLHFDDEITVSAWIRTPTATPFGGNTWPGIVTKGDSSWRIAVDGSGTTAEMASGLYGQPDFTVVAGVQTVTNATWKHIVGTYDSETIAIYIDGILDTTADVSDPIAKNDYRVRIGANAETIPPRALPAKIDEVRIFDRALSAARVLQMFADDGGGGACGQNYADSDFTQDCITDGDDLRVMIAEWLDCTDLTGVNCGN